MLKRISDLWAVMVVVFLVVSIYSFVGHCDDIACLEDGACATCALCSQTISTAEIPIQIFVHASVVFFHEENPLNPPSVFGEGPFQPPRV